MTPERLIFPKPEDKPVAMTDIGIKPLNTIANNTAVRRSEAKTGILITKEAIRTVSMKITFAVILMPPYDISGFFQ